MDDKEMGEIKDAVKTSIGLHFGNLPCRTHKLRIKILELIVYGAVGIILTITFAAIVLNRFPQVASSVVASIGR